MSTGVEGGPLQIAADGGNTTLALFEAGHGHPMNISAAARDGVAAAVRSALAESDRAAYRSTPEKVDEFWADAEAWGDE